MDSAVYPITLGNPIPSFVPFQEDPNDLLTTWNQVLWWASIPLSVAVIPIVFLAMSIIFLYKWALCGLTLQEMVADSLVVPVDRELLDRKRAEIVDHPRLLDIYQEVRDQYLRTRSPVDEARYRLYGNTPQTRFHTSDIRTEDGILLDGISFRPLKHILRPPSQQKWIVYLPGVGGNYETYHNSMHEMSRSTGANILSANYRGIGRSQGRATCSNDLVKDGRACVKALLDGGVLAENILIYGHSLGGGVAAAVAESFSRDEENPQHVNVALDRTFESLHAAVLAFIWLPFYRTIITLIYDLWWDLNTYENIRHIRGRKWLIVAHQDFIIGYKDASIYTAFIRRGETPPPALHLRYPVDPLNSFFRRMTDLAMTHTYDLPSEEFTQLISDFLR